LHPEQEAQHSAEEQHDAFAAFTAPAKPSAITATNRIALILFMFSPFLDERVLVNRRHDHRRENGATLLMVLSKYEGGAF
jgi:hypothetical protein